MTVTHKMLTPRFDALIADLPSHWPLDSFVLVGSAALAARGVRDVNDLDVLVLEPQLWLDIERLGKPVDIRPNPDPAYQPGARAQQAGEPPRARVVQRRRTPAGFIDFLDELPRIAQCITPEMTLADSAQIYVGQDVRPRRIVSLRHCLAIKALAGRPKDIGDMVQLAQLIALEEGAPTTPEAF